MPVKLRFHVSVHQCHLSLSCSVFFSMLSFSVNSMSSRAARPMLTAVGRAEVRWHRESLMKETRSSPPAPARSSTARLRHPTMAMAGAPRTCRVKGHTPESEPHTLQCFSLRGGLFLTRSALTNHLFKLIFMILTLPFRSKISSLEWKNTLLK